MWWSATRASIAPRSRGLQLDEGLASRVTVMVDDVAQLDLIDAVVAAGQAHADPGLPRARRLLPRARARPPRRAPQPGAHARRRRARWPRRSSRRPGFTLVGMMAYEAQIAGVDEQGAGQARGAARCSAPRRAELGRASRSRGRGRPRDRRPRVRQRRRHRFARVDPRRSERHRDRRRVRACSARTCSTATGSSRRHRPPRSRSAWCDARPPTSRRCSAAAGSHPAPRRPTGCRSSPGREGLRMLPREAAGEVQTPVTGAGARATSRSATGSGCATPRPGSSASTSNAFAVVAGRRGRRRAADLPRRGEGVPVTERPVPRGGDRSTRVDPLAQLGPRRGLDPGLPRAADERRRGASPSCAPPASAA